MIHRALQASFYTESVDLRQESAKYDNKRNLFQLEKRVLGQLNEELLQNGIISKFKEKLYPWARSKVGAK